MSAPGPRLSPVTKRMGTIRDCTNLTFGTHTKGRRPIRDAAPDPTSRMLVPLVTKDTSPLLLGRLQLDNVVVLTVKSPYKQQPTVLTGFAEDRYNYTLNYPRNEPRTW